MRFLIALVGFAAGLLGQTLESIEYRANMVPSVAGLDAIGGASVVLRNLRDPSGRILLSGTGNSITLKFGPATNVTTTELRRIADDPSAPAAATLGGSGSVTGVQNTQQNRAITADVAAEVLRDPAKFEVVVKTTDAPSGALRGPLRLAEEQTMLVRLSSANVTPPIPNFSATALARVSAFRMKNTAPDLNVVNLSFQADSRFPGQNTVSRFVILSPASSGLGAFVFTLSSTSGADGALSIPDTRSNLVSGRLVPDNQAFVDGFFSAPEGFNSFLVVPSLAGAPATTGGNVAMSGPLRRTSRMVLRSVSLPLAGRDDFAAFELILHTLQDSRGAITGGYLALTVLTQTATGFAGISAIELRAVSSAASAPPALTFFRATTPGLGSTRAFQILASTDAELAVLENLVRNPENFELVVASTDLPNQPLRGRLCPAVSALPALDSIVSAVNDANLKTTAPGGLITIFGRNLSKLATDLNGVEGRAAPPILNGTEVRIGGRNALLLAVAADSVVAQVPFETTPGTYDVTVRNSNGESAPIRITVAAAAPGLFFDGVGGLILKASDYSLIRPNNPAGAGDLLLVYSINLGQTTPPLVSGASPPAAPPFAATAPVTAFLGGKAAEVLYSIAAPGFVGLYQLVLRVPEGVPAGPALLTIRSSGADSNGVMIQVR